MADDKLEIQTAIDTDGVDDGMINIKNLVAKGMDLLNNSVSVGVTSDTMTENGENIYEKLSEKAKEMGATTKFSASEAEDALNYLALAGYDAEKACDALSALGIDATTENLQRFGDVLAKTASKSNTSVEQLGDALLVCGGQAKMSGLELNEMATQAMEQLGISASDAVTGELRPVQEVLMDTMSAMESLSEADRMQAMSDIFDVQVLASASAALNNSSDRFNELSAEIADCDGAMQQMADTMNDNLEGDLAGFNSSLEGLGSKFTKV